MDDLYEQHVLRSLDGLESWNPISVPALAPQNNPQSIQFLSVESRQIMLVFILKDSVPNPREKLNHLLTDCGCGVNHLKDYPLFHYICPNLKSCQRWLKPLTTSHWFCTLLRLLLNQIFLPWFDFLISWCDLIVLKIKVLAPRHKECEFRASCYAPNPRNVMSSRSWFHVLTDADPSLCSP